MTNNNRINPEVVKAAAEIATDQIIAWTGVVQRGGIPPVAVSEDRKTGEVFAAFDPLRNDAAAHVLMLALMKEGWEFSQNVVSKRYWASMMTYESEDGFGSQKHADESFPLLLLKCVAAMRGVEVFV